MSGLWIRRLEAIRPITNGPHHFVRTEDGRWQAELAAPYLDEDDESTLVSSSLETLQLAIADFQLYSEARLENREPDTALEWADRALWSTIADPFDVDPFYPPRGKTPAAPGILQPQRSFYRWLPLYGYIAPALLAAALFLTPRNVMNYDSSLRNLAALRALVQEGTAHKRPGSEKPHVGYYLRANADTIKILDSMGIDHTMQLWDRAKVY